MNNTPLQTRRYSSSFMAHWIWYDGRGAGNPVILHTKFLRSHGFTNSQELTCVKVRKFQISELTKATRIIYYLTIEQMWVSGDRNNPTHQSDLCSVKEQTLNRVCSGTTPLYTAILSTKHATKRPNDAATLEYYRISDNLKA